MYTQSLPDIKNFFLVFTQKAGYFAPKLCSCGAISVLFVPYPAVKKAKAARCPHRRVYYI
jgi:hypothetical protein